MQVLSESFTLVTGVGIVNSVLVGILVGLFIHFLPSMRGRLLELLVIGYLFGGVFFLSTFVARVSDPDYPGTPVRVFGTAFLWFLAVTASYVTRRLLERLGL